MNFNQGKLTDSKVNPRRLIENKQRGVSDKKINKIGGGISHVVMMRVHK
jgi:hypothetical protein